MMGNKSIAVLVVVILAMGLAVYVHQRDNAPQTGGRIGKPVFPQLASRLGTVQEVKLQSPDKTTTIEWHKGNRWTIDQKDGYEADFNKLSAFLDSLSKAKYIERKTSKPGNFAELDLSGIDNSTSKAVDVSVTTSDGSNYELLIGKKSVSESGRFVRKPAENQVWLVDQIKGASSDPLQWIEPVIFSIDSGQVSSVTDRSADGKSVLTVTRKKGGGDFIIEHLPKNATLKYPTIAASLSRSLDNVRASDVRARGSAPWKHAITADYRFKDGSRLVVHGMQDANGRYWLRFDLTVSKKPSEDISFINQDRLKNFEFRVADYTFDQFTQKMSDMINEEKKGAGKSAASKSKT